jgi:hypothetical protein
VNSQAAIRLNNYTIVGTMSVSTAHIDMVNTKVVYGEQKYTPSFSIGAMAIYKSKYFITIQSNRLFEQDVKRKVYVNNVEFNLLTKLTIDSLSIGKMFGNFSTFGTIARVDSMQYLTSKYINSNSRIIDTIFGLGVGYRLNKILSINSSYIFGSNKLGFSKAVMVGMNLNI